MRRRRFLGAVLATASLAGCAGRGTGSGDGGTAGGQITPTSPNDDGQGSPGELRYLLEQQAIAVEYMTLRDDEIRVAYASEATTFNEFVDEVSRIADRFALYVGFDGPGSRLSILVRSRHQGSDWTQAKGFHVERAWADAFEKESMSPQMYLQKVLNTRRK